MSFDLKMPAKSLAAPVGDAEGGSGAAVVFVEVAAGARLITVEGESRPSDCKSSLSKSDGEPDAVAAP